MKYRAVQHPPLTALALLEQQEISFVAYGILAWIKTRNAVEFDDILCAGTDDFRPLLDAIDQLESAGLIEPVVEDAQA